MLDDAGARSPIQTKRQAEGRAAAAQERWQWRHQHAIAALGELGAQALAAARHHDRIAYADRIGGEPASILDPDLDQLFRSDPFADCGARWRRERGWNEHRLAAGQRTERCVEMVEAGIGELERDCVNPKCPLDRRRGGAIGTLAVSG